MLAKSKAGKRMQPVRLFAAGAALALAAVLGWHTTSSASASKAKPIDGLKMEQDAMEKKRGKPLKATGRSKRKSSGSVPRYHLENAWPSK